MRDINLSLLRIIFWNVNKKDLTKLLCSMVPSTNADVVVLNENRVTSQEMLKALQCDISQDFYRPQHISEERFHCFCQSPHFDLSEIYAGSRISVRNLQIGTHKVLLALVHGLDVRNYDLESRQSFIESLASDMRLISEQQGINKLILLGDFNMNPYERVMNLATGLNSMMTRACVERKHRQHLGIDYDLYYNPMWSLFGDRTDGPAGTIYDTSNQGPYGWSMFDQVIVHHSVVELFHNVQILTEAGVTSLMTRKGHPDKKKSSDHFPILVTLGENKDE
ncbi:MAG: hypothetical protein F6K30_09860 [Cyanothece sp. SIO2G6]|nr:hypothetical protein [Cyanothece sp. SIO2G6]